MLLSAITQRDLIAQAYLNFNSTLKAGGQPILCSPGWQGGSDEVELFWHPGHQLWAGAKRQKDRYWFSFGTGESRPGSSPNIVAEFNVPYEGINRSLAGAFARDDARQVYTMHSGRVGGGRPGIGKSAFLKFYHAARLATVGWPDRRQTKHILIGRIGDAALLDQVAEFVHVVRQFKESVAGTADTNQ
jgi:hypothetical protein